VNAWTKHTDRWTTAELDAALEALLITDAALKETRLSSPEQLLTTLVLRLCGADSSRRAA
jgi:DNA polymerase III delta subunit